MTVARISARPPGRSDSMGRPAASAKVTAPVVRSIVTGSFAVAMVAAFSVCDWFQGGDVHRRGDAISDGRTKNPSSVAKATRTMSSAQISTRRRPPATVNVEPVELAAAATEPIGRCTQETVSAGVARSASGAMIWRINRLLLPQNGRRRPIRGPVRQCASERGVMYPSAP
jgi:hypothetical protein